MAKQDNSARPRLRGLRTISQILLAVQVLSFGHLLLVHHVTCPEHGDIIHVAPSTAAASARGDSIPVSTLPALAAEGRQLVDGDHEACVICIDTSRRYALLPLAISTPVHRSIAVALVSHSRTASLAPFDLILLSPKNSPPAA